MKDGSVLTSPGVEIKHYQKAGTNLALWVSAPAGGWVDTNLFQFSGYTVRYFDGQTMEPTFGENNRLRILFPSDYEGEVQVRYTGKPLWSFCTVVSLATLAFTIFLILRKKTGLGSTEDHRKYLHDSRYPR